MMLVAEGLEPSLRGDFDDLTKLGVEEGEDSWSLLLRRTYPKQLARIERDSLQPRRIMTKQRRWSARGRVRPVETLRNLQLQADSPVLCDVSMKTLNTPENRVLGAAAHVLLRQGTATEPESVGVLQRWATRFGRARQIGADLGVVIDGLEKSRYRGSRSYYTPTLLVARLLLLEAGVSLESESLVDSEVILTNMPILFEKYVRSLTARFLHFRGYVVEKNETGAQSLFVDGTAPMIPDIVVSNSAGVRLVIDTKYKPKTEIASADYYQLVTYVENLGVRTKRGMLVLPTLAGAPIVPLAKTSLGGTTVIEVRLPLNDWLTSESILEAELQKALA
jgi:5-methylcytosine-specific restriction endonuclease McrBC regulatory subunit McrC